MSSDYIIDMSQYGRVLRITQHVRYPMIVTNPPNKLVHSRGSGNLQPLVQTLNKGKIDRAPCKHSCCSCPPAYLRPYTAVLETYLLSGRPCAQISSIVTLVAKIDTLPTHFNARPLDSTLSLI